VRPTGAEQIVPYGIVRSLGDAKAPVGVALSADARAVLGLPGPADSTTLVQILNTALVPHQHRVSSRSEAGETARSDERGVL
jgi:hypothetical protein